MQNSRSLKAFLFHQKENWRHSSPAPLPRARSHRVLPLASVPPVSGAARAWAPCGQGAAHRAGGVALTHDAPAGHPSEQAAAAPRPGPGPARLPMQPAPASGERQEGGDPETLRTIGPPGGFEPDFRLSENHLVSSAQVRPLLPRLREALPAPREHATALLAHPKLTWSQVWGEGGGWNLGKFLKGPDGPTPGA